MLCYSDSSHERSIDYSIENNSAIESLQQTDDVQYLRLAGNKGRLGNQIFGLISGYGIARSLNRRFYVTPPNMPRQQTFQAVLDIFPNVSAIFDVLNVTKENELLVKHAWLNETTPFCCAFEDPKHFSNITTKYLALRNTYAQNVLYFSNYLRDVRDLLRFSKSIIREGSEVMQNNNISRNASLLCAHIRRTDFIARGDSASFDVILKLISHLATKYHTGGLPPRLLLYGDDKSFMNRLITLLRDGRYISEDSLQSSFSSGLDLFLSSEVCSSFVVTSPMSTFGFWLAFLSRNQKDVYFHYDKFFRHRRFVRENFPLPWTALKMENGTVVEYKDLESDLI